MAFVLNNSPLYVKGTAEMWLHNTVTRDLEAYTNKVNTANFNSSVNVEDVRAGLGAPVVAQLTDSAGFTGEVNSADFSMEARKLVTGGTLKYNGTAPIKENITATSTTLTVSRQPVSAYGEASSNETYACYVGNDGVNYGVNPATKEIQNFTATVGQTYCVLYYTEIASAKELTIPSSFNPSVCSVTVKMAVYSGQGTSERNSSRWGYLYVYIPRASFANGSLDVSGSQTESTTSSWNFSALAYEEADVTCSECADDNSVFGYMVLVPCGVNAALSAVKGLIISQASPALQDLEVGKQAQTPVFYYMDNGELVTPQYTDLTFVSATEATATVNTEGVITGVAAGSAQITASTKALKPNVTPDTPLYTATVTVTVIGS